MDWDQWCRTYPAREVETAPEDFIYNFSSYIEAIKAADNVEILEEHAVDIVTCGSQYYLIYK